MTRFMQVFLPLVALLITARSIKTKQSSTNQQQCDVSFRSSGQRQSELFIDIFEQPCNDFWEYACGNWRPPSQLRFAEPSDTLSTIKASNKYLLLQYFDGVDKDLHFNSTDQEVATFYKSCLDKKAFKSKAQDEQAIQVYTDVLKSISSDWPVLQMNFSSNGLNKEKRSWEEIAAELRRYGIQALISTKIQSNWQNSQQLIYYILPPSFEFLKARKADTVYDAERTFLYQRYIKLLMMDLGVRVRKANQLAEEIIEFEKSLLALVKNDHSVVLKEPQTLFSLAAEVPDINLFKYFEILMKDFTLPVNYEKTMLIVADHNYLRSLSLLLKKSNSETIAKYFLVQFLAYFEVNLHDEYSFIKQKEECLMQLNDFMPSELTRLFLQLRHGKGEEFLTETEEKLAKLFENLKQQFEKLLNSTTVFERDPATKILSREKLREMKLLLPTLEGSNYDIALKLGESYDVNLINLSKLKVLKQLNKTIPHMVKDANSVAAEAKLFLASLHSEQTYGPLDVNAYYRLKKNAIELPIGILQAPLYDSCLKPAKIYGGLAYILAHEILHGFDYDGLNYDKLGNVANSWGVKAIIKFGVKSNCYLSDRYNNGHVTINENIADSEGLRLALETFLDNEMDATFDQDDLKLFFLSFAQTWCGNSNTDEASLNMHARHRERVNNVLGNFMEFADVFKCRPGNKMHPEEKCRIW